MMVDPGQDLAQMPLLSVIDGILFQKAPIPPTHELHENAEAFRLQRVVPHCKRLELFQHIHGRSARYMSYDHVYGFLVDCFFLDWYVHQCTSCQQVKPGPDKSRLPLKQELSEFPMDRIAMDVMGPWPVMPRMKMYVLVVHDYFSKWVVAWALPNHQAITVAQVLVRDYFSLYGAPL